MEDAERLGFLDPHSEGADIDSPHGSDIGEPAEPGGASEPGGGANEPAEPGGANEPLPAPPLPAPPVPHEVPAGLGIHFGRVDPTNRNPFWCARLPPGKTLDGQRSLTQTFGTIRTEHQAQMACWNFLCRAVATGVIPPF